MPRRIHNTSKRANRLNPRIGRNLPDNHPHFEREYRKHSRLPEEITHRRKIELEPRNDNQADYIDALLDETKTVVIAYGPAGTGKSYLAVLHCIQQLLDGVIEKIIILRPVITADGSTLGALPGNIIDKIGPYIGEVMSILKEFLGVKTVLRMLENEVIEILPIALARGRSLRRSGIIIEEGQNIEEHVTKLLLTRIAEGSRMYINGDINQTDRGFNGLRNLLSRLEQNGGSDHFAVCQFSKQDVERHPVVGEVLRIYDEED